MDIKIPKIGEKTEKYFEKLNLFTKNDLMEYYPKRYIEYPAPVSIDNTTIGEKCAIRVQLKKAPILKEKSTIAIAVDEKGREIKIIWFFNIFKLHSLKIGDIYIFYGLSEVYNNSLQMVQPEVYTPEEYVTISGYLHPVYKLTKGLSNKTLETAIDYVINNELENNDGELKETLPSNILQKYNFYNRTQAICAIHRPVNTRVLKEAIRRIKYEEFFTFLTKVETNKRKRKEGPVFIKHELTDSVIEKLPFDLTNAQRLTWEDIKNDTSKNIQMNRLVQGDVGSGKTIISFLALFLAAENGYQGALMAPTEVLAKQHADEMKSMIQRYNLPFSCVDLLGSTRKKEIVCNKIKNGDADIIVGTHAMIQDNVEYKNLGISIVDEQHRFGVDQRNDLSNKADNPHILVMSATPIPRSLGQVLYADLDISIVNELPANRKPIKNAVLSKEKRGSAWKMIYSQILKGHQAYIICSRVENEGNEEKESVTNYVKTIRSVFPDNINIAMLYGKMKADEKTKVMKAFSENKYQILVSTTVVEVGINVPNATVILIEDANMFGLSQLHQLRGRVGRGDSQSYCIFINGSDKECERLNIMWNSNDGFKIAEEDLKMRGMGDIFGTSQSGHIAFKLADIYRDTEIMNRAKKDIQEIARQPS